MLIILVLSLAGLLWLAHRFSLLLSLSLDSSVKSLAIPIPKIPLMSVDKVTDTSIVLRWNNSTGVENLDPNIKNLNLSKKDRENLDSHIISHHVLYINGIETLSINGSQDKCTLENLQPGNNYQIDLVTFNMARFRSKSSSIFVKTASKPINNSNIQDLVNLENVMNCLLHEKERESASFTNQSKSNGSGNRSRSGTLEKINNDNRYITATPNNNNNNYGNNPSITTKSIQHINLIDDINELKWMLESGLNELQTVIQMGKMSDLYNEEEESRLLGKLDEVKEIKVKEDIEYKNIQTSIKWNQQRRLLLDSKIANDSKRIKERQKNIDSFKRQIEKFQNEISIMNQDREKLSKTNPEKIKQLEKEIQGLNNLNFLIDTEVQSLEHEAKNENILKKELEADKIKISELFDDINSNTSEVTGLLNDKGIESLNSLCKLMPEWESELLEQYINIDEKQLENWKHLQKQEYAKYQDKKVEMENSRFNSVSSNKSISKSTPLAIPLSNNSTVNSKNGFIQPNSIISPDTSSVGSNSGILSSSMKNNDINSINNNTGSSTIATSNTNVHGFLYGSLPSSSNVSVNGFNSQSMSGSTMRNLIRPRITTNGSFQGNDMLNEIPQQKSEPTSSNKSKSPWNQVPLSIDLTDHSNLVDDSVISPTVNMLLPQDLIDGDDITQMFNNQLSSQKNSKSSTSDNKNTKDLSNSINSMISPSLSGLNSSQNISIPPPSSLLNNAPTVSPNLSQMNSFEVYQNNSLNELLNSTPQNNRVSTLGSLTGNNNIASPENSLNAHIRTSSLDNNNNNNSNNTNNNSNNNNNNSNNNNNLTTNLMSLTNAMSTSPYNSNNGMNLDIDSSIFNQNSLLLGATNNLSRTDSNNHYTNIFEIFNGSSHHHIDDTNGTSRGRSNSFGSSIWSNGNNVNIPNNTWGTNNPNSGNLNTPNGFSYLSAPITMTPTRNDSTGLLGYNISNDNIDVNKKTNNGNSNTIPNNDNNNNNKTNNIVTINSNNNTATTTTTTTNTNNKSGNASTSPRLSRKGRLMFSNSRSHGHSSLTASNPVNEKQTQPKSSSPHQIEQQLSDTSNDEINESPESLTQSSSPSFLKSVIGKLGASPTKTMSHKNADTSNEFNDFVSIDHQQSLSRADSTTSNNGSGSNHSKNISSRFFKLPRKNSIASTIQSSSTNGSNLNNTSENGGIECNSNSIIEESDSDVKSNTGSNTSVTGSNSGSGGFIGRKLSFPLLSKRDKDKDKE